ncbi:hypothetical protein G6F57_003418 [Rhizopus arrhizus]|uniref:Uncharacterized protein n=1 Tax=Rhizopus oryzae TaxID=64495 RepID=A0A9P6X7H8_RHIOR|nr:hypothetical protein G6F30_000519 [Rhizopus arrhizus]KAG1427820.1 hypothetical protein G6F58_000844 [Rhizopus delemar]KAG0990190.1 hypothetical protein G6F29_000419 [Rhizopus arrhizus]KAG0997328.1 hypothetical protein G6F28_003006 [Rhizopus arrhizus]KAG1009949.1 hypothetical protein G6F27_005118 [Rhizopus arrhizus]
MHAYQLVHTIDKITETAKIKALELPASIKHLEYSTEEDGKKNSFDEDFVERFQRVRFEDKIIKDAASFRRGYHNNRGFNHGYGLRRRPWRGNWSRGQSFHAGGRSRGTPFPNNETIHLNSQEIQHPTTENNSTEFFFTSSLYQAAITTTTSSTVLYPINITRYSYLGVA